MQRLSAVLLVLCVWILSSLRPVMAQMPSTLVNGAQVIVGHVNYCEPVGATDAYACNLLELLLEYNTGTFYAFKADVANTGPASLNLNGIGMRPLKKVQGSITTDLIANDIRAGQIVEVYYDGTNMQVVSQLGNAPTGGGVTWQNVTQAPCTVPRPSRRVSLASPLLAAPSTSRRGPTSSPMI
jgi:hypothetical protein